MTLELIKPLTDREENRLLLYGIGGSQSYGMATPESDFDYGGIYIQNPREVFVNPYLDNTQQFEFKHDSGMHEGTVYEFKKAIKLIADNNPNMIELLWRHPKHVLFNDVIGIRLLAYAPKLLSKKAKFTFSGYAHAQFKRIKGHNKWINNPQPKEPPKMASYFKSINCAPEISPFELLGCSVLEDQGNNVYAAYYTKDYCSFVDGQLKKNIIERDRGWPQAGIFVFNHKEYREAKHKHEQYWQWFNNRNKKRSKLEIQYGYDTKHAAHLIRLMRMGIEILEEGQVRVYRPDAQELLDVRNGMYTYDELKHEFEVLDARINSIYETSTLRKTVDPKTITDLYSDVWDMCHSN